jgi:hypothetical protein
MISNVSRVGAGLWSIRNCRNPSSRWHVQAVGSLSRLMVSLKGAGLQGCGRKGSGCAAAPSAISRDISHPYADMAAYFECLCEPNRIAVGAGKRASGLRSHRGHQDRRFLAARRRPFGLPELPGFCSVLFYRAGRDGADFSAAVAGPVLPDTANCPCNVPHGKLSFPHNPRISFLHGSDAYE